jgi:putative salt-induced outer membrane protein
MNRTKWILAFFAMLWTSAARADLVTLKNGDRLTGKIQKSDGKVMLIKTELAGDVNVQWDAIDRIESKGPLFLTLKDGQIIAGEVTTHNGNYEVVTMEAGTVTAAQTSVTIIRNQTEQASFDAEVARLENPRLTDFWGGYLDAALSLTQGNSDTLSFVLGARAVRTTTRDTISVYAHSVFQNNGTLGPTVTTANAIAGGIRIDLNLTDRWFVFGFTDFQHDEFQQLNLRNVLGGGVGYRVIKSKTTQFNVYGGGAYDQAYYSTPLTVKSGEIMVGESFFHAFGPRTSFNQRFEFYPNLSYSGQYRFILTAGDTTKINNWLNWQLTFANNYVSNPPPGIKNNDLLLSTGVRLMFGKVPE